MFEKSSVILWNSWTQTEGSSALIWDCFHRFTHIFCSGSQPFIHSFWKNNKMILLFLRLSIISTVKLKKISGQSENLSTSYIWSWPASFCMKLIRSETTKELQEQQQNNKITGRREHLVCLKKKIKFEWLLKKNITKVEDCFLSFQ